MDIEEVKVPVGQLKLGMYVSRLDRPWLDSPFKFQGFPLNDIDVIAQIQELCDYVYVDFERSSDKASLIRHRMGVGDEATGAGVEKPPPRRRISKYTEAAKKSSRRFGEFGIEDADEERRLLVLGKGVSYPEEVPTEDEIKPARQALDSCIQTVRSTFDSVRDRGELDPEQIGRAVEGVVDSITRNPDALIWLARLGDASDYTYRHCINMSIWAIALGRQIGLPAEDLQLLGQGALYCDLGKAKLPPAVLKKDGPLVAWEMEMVRLHVDYALEILEECGEAVDPAVLSAVAQHHERFDGTGYPGGLAGDQIDLYGRITAITDCFDAMISDRAYARSVPISDAVREMYWARGKHFQAELMEEFIHSIGLYPAGTLVELSTGGVGVVIGQSRVRRLRPRIMLLLGKEKEALEHYPVIDLMQEDTDEDGNSLHIVRDLKHGAYGLDPSQYFF